MYKVSIKDGHEEYLFGADQKGAFSSLLEATGIEGREVVIRDMKNTVLCHLEGDGTLCFPFNLAHKEMNPLTFLGYCSQNSAFKVKCRE